MILSFLHIFLGHTSYDSVPFLRVWIDSVTVGHVYLGHTLYDFMIILSMSILGIPCMNWALLFMYLGPTSYEYVSLGHVFLEHMILGILGI